MPNASLNIIKARLKSVENTRQITKAMELVSTSKLRRSKDRAEKTRPYHKKLIEGLSSLCSLDENKDDPFIVGREVRKTAYIVIAGDRGLAGGYNSNVFKLVSSLAGKDDLIIPIGKKATDYFNKKSFNIVDVGRCQVDKFKKETASDLSSFLCSEYLKKNIDKAVVVYTEFISMMTQTPRVEQILPINLPENDGDADLPIYDGQIEEIIRTLVPFVVSGVIYSSVAEAEASENASRMNAMSSATKNAGEIIDDLHIKFNRARQAAITQEITEIVSGAEAL